MLSFRTIDQADVSNKRVLVRIDLNVPMDHGKVADRTRIERTRPPAVRMANSSPPTIFLSQR